MSSRPTLLLRILATMSAVVGTACNKRQWRARPRGAPEGLLFGQRLPPPWSTLTATRSQWPAMHPVWGCALARTFASSFALSAVVALSTGSPAMTHWDVSADLRTS